MDWHWKSTDPEGGLVWLVEQNILRAVLVPWLRRNATPSVVMCLELLSIFYWERPCTAKQPLLLVNGLINAPHRKLSDSNIFPYLDARQKQAHILSWDPIWSYERDGLTYLSLVTHICTSLRKYASLDHSELNQTIWHSVITITCINSGYRRLSP